ncbi:MAG: hypothetical protein J1F22_08465 [Lachnospiraceae bacterium]|nr:hypothetical protein [Lachnospiraceae bacterium]
MNASKKLMNQGKKEDVGAAKSASAPTSTSKIGSASEGPSSKAYVLGGFCVLLILVLCIGVAAQQFKSTTVLKIDDTKLSMDDMMFPIYERESQYAPSNEAYEMYLGTSVWDAGYMGEDTTVDESLSNAEGLKQEIINSETEYEVLYREAVKADYSLTDDEKKDAKDRAKKAVKGLSWSQKLQLSISEKKLTNRFEKRILADRYKEDRKKETDAKVNEADVKKDISKENLREYDVQYYYFGKTDTDMTTGEEVTLTDEEVKKYASELKKLAKKAKKADDFTTLLGDTKETATGQIAGTETEDDAENSAITYETAEFTEEDGWGDYLSEDNVKKIKKMKNGEISDVIVDDTTGYYMFVKMVDNNSTASYDEACEEAITEAQQNSYNEWLEEIKKGYTIKQYDDVWGEVTIGTVTTDIVTVDDLNKMAEDEAGESSESE